jgi:methyltransferase (TIGR00027 family)
MSVQSTRPIRSAIAVAALRAASTKEADPTIANPDHLARYFVSGLYALLINLPFHFSRHLIEWITPGSYCYFLARTRFIDHYFKHAVAQNIKQIVILGAGYDSRALRLLGEDSDITVFEIDLPATQQDKLQKMEKTGLSTQAHKVVYITDNFDDAGLENMLRENGFDFGMPCFFIFEGVSYYLEEQSVRDIFYFVGEHCATGSAVAFDYSIQSFVEGGDNTYGGKKMQQWLKKNKEPFKFGLPVGELDAFLKATRLKVVEDIGPDDFSVRYLQTTSGRIIGKPLGHLRLAYAAKEF